MISTRLFAGRTIVHVLSDTDPGNGFAPVEGGLEDVYLSTLTRARRAAARKPHRGQPRCSRTIARFELRYQMRNPVFWVGIVLFFLLTFGATTAESIRLGSGGNIHTNAPTAIAQIHADHVAVLHVRDDRVRRQRGGARR